MHHDLSIRGAGIVGLWQAFVLSRRGHRVRLLETSAVPFAHSASRWAGAMIAPDCEAEGQPPRLRDWGRAGLDLWRRHVPNLKSNGTLVVAQPRDHGELKRFARDTQGHTTLNDAALSELEPYVGERFATALWYENEAHVEADGAMSWLLQAARDNGVDVQLGVDPAHVPDGLVIDCRGYAAKEALKDLRGVRGERLLVQSHDVVLSRPVRLLHPRQPIYIVPQSDGRFVIGATVIERDDDGPMTVKSALDLLAAAYTVHPGFSEAAICDLGAGVRPAFADNLPHITADRAGHVISVNGAYRHGFLLAPVMATAVADYLEDGRCHDMLTVA